VGSATKTRCPFPSSSKFSPMPCWCIMAAPGKRFLNAQKKDTLPTCKEAFYGKLRRLPLELSVAFMTEASRRLNELLPVQNNPLPASLHGYQVRIIDGKKTKHIAKKLKLTRAQAGQLFGAKLLAAYDPATRLIQAMSAHADGEKNDAPLVPDLLAQVRTPTADKPIIHVADAQFLRPGADHSISAGKRAFYLALSSPAAFSYRQRHAALRRRRCQGSAGDRRIWLVGFAERRAADFRASHHLETKRPQGPDHRHRFDEPFARPSGCNFRTDRQRGPDRFVSDALEDRDRFFKMSRWCSACAN